jgi:hypothetical protein
MIPIIGAVMIPIGIFFFNRPWKLLALVFYFSVFAAAAIAVFGGAGITPALLPCLLFVLCFMVSIFSGVRYPAARQAITLLTPFILVILGALISSLVMPRLFQGDVLVWPQKIALFFVRMPLAPNSGNYTQDMYLLADATLTVTATIYLARPGVMLNKLFDCYLSASLIADCVALWQFAGNSFHLWYPSSFFLSNPGWAQLSEESVGSLIRINGPFSEPSSLAAYLCAPVAASAWLILNGDKRRFLQIVFWLGLSVTLLSTSTTGYATLGVMVAMLVLRSTVSASARFRQRVVIAAIIISALVGGASIIIPAAAPGVANEVSTIINSTLGKSQSSSYRDRSAADSDSISEMLETSGLGVGWGSNRSSSLLPGLCASIGVWGIFGLLWFGALIYLELKKISKIKLNPETKRGGMSVAIITSLVAASISEPNITSPDFYLLLAMLVSSLIPMPESKRFVANKLQKMPPQPYKIKKTPELLY